MSDFRNVLLIWNYMTISRVEGILDGSVTSDNIISELSAAVTMTDDSKNTIRDFHIGIRQIDAGSDQGFKIIKGLLRSNSLLTPLWPTGEPLHPLASDLKSVFVA